MDTNVIIAIVVAVVVIAAIIIGAWWFGKASKRSVERATDEAVAKGVQLATEDTEHAGNADADHTQHAEVSAASVRVCHLVQSRLVAGGEVELAECLAGTWHCCCFVGRFLVGRQGVILDDGK